MSGCHRGRPQRPSDEKFFFPFRVWVTEFLERTGDRMAERLPESPRWDLVVKVPRSVGTWEWKSKMAVGRFERFISFWKKMKWINKILKFDGCAHVVWRLFEQDASAKVWWSGRRWKQLWRFSVFAGNLFKLAESNRIGFGRLVGRLKALGGVDNVNKLLLVRRMRDNALVNEESDVCCCWANNWNVS